MPNPKNPRANPRANPTPITAVLLAGGRGTRMQNADKGLLTIHGKPLAHHICTALTRQPPIAEILINANRNLPAYQTIAAQITPQTANETATESPPETAPPLPPQVIQVIPDDPTLGTYQGPLAGILTALHHATHPWLLTLPCDAPHLAPDYAAKMLAAAQTHRPQPVPLAIAHDGTRLQPVHALIHRTLAPSLAQYLQNGDRKPDRWYAQHPHALADFSTHPQMFTNINTPDQLAAAGGTPPDLTSPKTPQA